MSFISPFWMIGPLIAAASWSTKLSRNKPLSKSSASKQTVWTKSIELSNELFETSTNSVSRSKCIVKTSHETVKTSHETVKTSHETVKTSHETVKSNLFYVKSGINACEVPHN